MYVGANPAPQDTDCPRRRLINGVSQARKLRLVKPAPLGERVDFGLEQDLIGVRIAYTRNELPAGQDALYFTAKWLQSILELT